MAKDRANIFTNRYEDTERPGQGFWKMMMVWHGSVLKLIWPHLIAFILAYAGLSILYRTVLIDHEEWREIFELVCIYCSRFSSKIPVTFMIGFYVANVVSRYWDQFISLPWPDKIAFKLVGFIPGQDDYSRTLRRTIMRYLNLSTVLVFRTVAQKVRERFPNYKSLIEAGLLLPGEDTRLSAIEAMTPHETSWVPMLWAVNLLQTERTSGRLKVEATIYSNILNSFEYIENCNRKIFNHGWVNFPFAYSQVITLTVYTYLFANLFGHQYLEPTDELKANLFKDIGVSIATEKPYDLHTPVVHVPVFTLIEFIAYFGWIKVAETLLNPWGDDDEDFQVNYLIDRNFQTSFLIVDDAIEDFDMSPDVFMSKQLPLPSELPYNKKSRRSKVILNNKTAWEKDGWFSRLQQNISVSTAEHLRRLNIRPETGSANGSTTVSPTSVKVDGTNDNDTNGNVTVNDAEE